MPEFPLQPALLGDIADGQHQPAHGRIVAEVAAGHLDLHRATVRPPDLPVQGALAAVARPDPLQLLAESHSVPGPEHVGHVDALQLRVAEHGLGGRTGVGDPLVAVDDEDDVGGVQDERPEVGLVVAAVDLVGQRDPLDRQRALRGEHLQAALLGHQRRVVGGHEQRADVGVDGRPVIENQRAEQRRAEAVEPGVHRRAEVGGTHQLGAPHGGHAR